LDFASGQKPKIINFNFDNVWKTVPVIKKTDGTFKYPMITKLINAIRFFPNSNADAKRIFSMLTDVKTKKRNKLRFTLKLCVFKLNLRARGKTAQTMKVDARHLALMSSENFHQTNATKDAYFLRLFADGCPSTSLNLQFVAEFRRSQTH